MDRSIKRAINLKELGELKEAIAILKEKVLENPLNMEAYPHLIHALSLNGEEAKAWFFLQKAENIDSQNAMLLANKARLLLRKKDINGAFETIQISLNKNRNSAFALLILSNIFRVKGIIDKAKLAVDLSIKAEPKYAEAYAFRAMLNQHNRDMDMALADIKNALILKPHLADMLDTFISEKNRKEIIDMIEQMLNHISKDKQPKLLTKLGEYRYANGDITDAINCFELALKINPNLANVHKKIANLFTMKIDTLDNAIKHYNKAMSINPNDFELFNNIAAILVIQKKEKLAIENYKKALVLNPTAIKVYDNLANLLMQEKRFDEAFEILEKALSIEPNYFDIYMRLGQYFTEIEKLDKSIESVSYTHLTLPTKA